MTDFRHADNPVPFSKHYSNDKEQSMTETITKDFRQRLTDNANDFDQIVSEILAENEAFKADAERLDFMISTGAHISWSNDDEVCNVWLPANRDGEDSRPVGGYPQKCYLNPREAIDEARKHHE